MNKQITNLINHVWGKCINSEDGKALFHGDSLAIKYLGEQTDWIDSLRVLRDTPEIKINAFYIDGISEKIIQVSIDPIYCTEEYRRMTRMLTGERTRVSQEMSDEEVKTFKKSFFADLMQGMA